MSNEFVARKGLISLKSSSFHETIFSSGSVFIGTPATHSQLVVSGSSYISDDVRVGQNISGSSLYLLGHIQSDTSSAPPSWREGMLFWDSANHTYAVYNEKSDITIQLGQEVLYRVVAGEDIINGEAVYGSGSISIGGDYYSNVYKAIADATGKKSNVVGVATHNIPSGSIGYITTMGVVHDIPTEGLSEGAIVYLSHSVPGGITTTYPPEPYETVIIGYCIKASGGVGHIFVNVVNTEMINRAFVGVTVPPSITDNGGGNFTIGTGSVSLCTTLDGLGEVKNYQINSASFTLTADVSNYQFIVATYNNGNPIWGMVDDLSSVDSVQTTVVYSVTRALNNTLAYVSWDSPGILLANKLLLRTINIFGVQRDEGLVLSQSGSGYITISEGSVWSGVSKNSLPPFDSRVDDLYLLSHSGSVGYSASRVTGMVSNYYDDGTSLQPMPANRYVVNYIYKSITNQNRALITLSLPHKDVAAAQTDQPWPLPGDMLYGGILVGRMVVYVGSTSASLIESAFSNTFNYSAISDHNSLSNLQGGTGGQFYHLTAAEYANLGVSSSYAVSASYAATSSYSKTSNGLVAGVSISVNEITSSAMLFSGSNASNIRVRVSSSGDVTFYGDSQGDLFTLSDTSNGVLASIGEVVGHPIFEVRSDDTVQMGTNEKYTLYVTGSQVGILTNHPDYDLDVSGSARILNALLTGSLYGTSSWALTASYMLGSPLPANLVSGSLTGSLLGTASWAALSTTASYSSTGLSSSYAITSSHAGDYPNRVKHVTILDPAANDQVTMMYTQDQITILKIAAVVRGATTPTASFTLRYNAGRTGSVTDVVTGGTTISSSNNAQTITSFDNATIPANNWVWVIVNSVSGTISELGVTIQM